MNAAPRIGTAVGGPQLEITPESSRVDEPVRIRIRHLIPRGTVDLVLNTTDGALLTWQSRAQFEADENGVVDLARDAPRSGSYTGVDNDGLFWSMLPKDGKLAFFKKTTPTPMRYRLTVEVDERDVADAEFDRHFGHPTVQRDALEGPDVVGSLHRARSGVSQPGILLWSGSDGGLLDHAAMLLSAQGYTVLSLAYVGVENRPMTLNHIDLRYIEHAIDWLLAHEATQGDDVGIVGLSRGAELALQVASDDRRVGPVVAGAPSSIRQAGLTSNYTDFTQPAWVRDDEALPFVKGKFGFRGFLSMLGVFVLRRPMRQLATFRRGLRDETAVAEASIPVERCRGPLLLIAGESDQLWPSPEYTKRIRQRLEEHNWPGTVESMILPDVGHFVAAPYAVPSLPPMTRMSPTKALTIDFGGQPEAHAAAARKTWNAQLALFERWRSRMNDTTPANDELADGNR